MLDRLRATLPAEAFAGLVRRGIENAERACARLPTLPAGSEEQVREAHSLKGTAGTFGQVGLGLQFWLNVLLTLLGYVPGIAHAVYIIVRR
jgi:hypothetical protein